MPTLKGNLCEDSMGLSKEALGLMPGMKGDQ